MPTQLGSRRGAARCAPTFYQLHDLRVVFIHHVVLRRHQFSIPQRCVFLLLIPVRCMIPAFTGRVRISPSPSHGAYRSI